MKNQRCATGNRRFVWVGICTSLLFSTQLEAAGRSFQVRFTADVHSSPFSGRVYVIFSQRRQQPRQGPNWFTPESFIARDVTDVQPGAVVEFSSDAPQDAMLAYPRPLAEMRLAGFRAQAVVRFNPHDRNIGTGAGNGFSSVVVLPPDTDDGKPIRLEVDQLVPERPFRETKWSKLLRVESKLLSKFHQRSVSLQAAVMLPASYYEQPDRRYPTLFTIPGFGGTHHAGSRNAPIGENNRDGVEFIRVLLDPSCPLGHHVFANSANNGPVGDALVTELIPAFDGRFRSIAKPGARFLTGHSSGGWSSLWLQVTYPQHFGGTWSTAPDPVDFRDFQRINLYRAQENMYTDPQGGRRPLARVRGQVRLLYQGFAEMEWVLGHGGQLHSFEAVFSPRGEDGKPMLVWDRKTGRVDTRVAETWRKYDIRLILEQNWARLAPQLSGKIHVHMGELDTFYLEGATRLLKQSMAKLNSDAVVEMYPGKDHGSVMTAQLRNRMRREMVDAFLSRFPNGGVE